MNTASDGQVSPPTEDHARHESAAEKLASESESAEPSTEAQAEAAEMAEAMDRMLDQFPAAEAAAEGEIFDGHVLAVTDAGVVVDVGGKFEGLVPAQEFLDSGAPIEFGPGQTIEVERLHERKDGYVLLSHVRAHRRRSWERIEKASREHTNLTG
ncbi:MAG: S1 RNA-binding domain-containing protein, partial [Bryobacteraceae bacterium]